MRERWKVLLEESEIELETAQFQGILNTFLIGPVSIP